MLGGLFSLVSSASFGFNNAAVRRGFLHGSVTQAIYVTVILGVPLFLIAAWISGEIFEVSGITLRGYVFFILAGVIHFYAGRYFNFRSIAALGANRSAPIRNMAIPVSVVIAVVVLEEHLTLFMILGIVLIMTGPFIIFETKKPKNEDQDYSDDPDSKNHLNEQTSDTEKKEFVPNQKEGYIFGSLTSIAYGISPILIRSALQESNLPVLGCLISYISASSVILFSLILPGRLQLLRSMNPKAVAWFLVATVAVFFAQMFRYIALSIAPVTIVGPLQRTSGIFALFFAYFINRDAESFGFRVILGIVLAIIGSVILVI